MSQSNINNDFKKTWETYTSSWKVESTADKLLILKKCLDSNCTYNDPLIKTIELQALVDYMLDFHKQISGGHFVTTYFLAHHNQSIAKWDMLNANGDVLGNGISYGKYNDEGKLIAVTGFFEVPS